MIVQPVDLGVEVELDDDVMGRLREPGDVVAEVSGYVVGVGQQRHEGVLRRVVERLARYVFQHGALVLEARRELVGSLQHLFFGGLQHAVEAAQHR